MLLTPHVVSQSITRSIRKRAFSKKQTKNQKLKVLLITTVIFVLIFPFSKELAFFLAFLTFIFTRWAYLKVIDVKEGLIFLFASIYTFILSVLSKIYSFLYTTLFRHIKRFEFFPEFPFDKQTFTESLTKNEINFRDKFWGPKISKTVLSPNSLTIIRILGSFGLLFLSRINDLNFFLLVFILFLTDYFDGIIARTQKRETTFGKWSDPIADRLLLLSIIYFLYFKNEFFWKENLPKIAIPELILAIFGIVLLLTGIKIIPKAVFWGRLKFSLYFFAVISLFQNNLVIANFLIKLGIFFSYVALVSYITRAYQLHYNRSIFKGILQWCATHSQRISNELREIGVK